ncbi:MAG: mandelate racemase/muconate lactonizing enzyme family protein [Armatimonadota bacterium]
MTIASVSPRDLLVPLDQPIPASVARPRTEALPVRLVRVQCRGGEIAWGEAWWSDRGELHEALDVLAPTILGADPLDRLALWERMVDRLTSLKEPLPAGAAALSAIDVALWDLAGRSAGMPVWRLIGGRRFARLDAYATGIYLEEPDVAAEKAEAMLESGFRAVKIKAGAGLERDLRVLEAVREAVGPQVPVLVDANQAFEDLQEAMDLGAALDRHEVFWYEEPMPPGDWSDYVSLRHAVDTPIAGGERLRSPGSFLQALRAGALDVVMPDVRLCGGITGMLKAAELARWFGVRVSPHNWASQLGAIASGHAAVTLSNCVMTELEATRTPLTESLLDPPLALEDGFLIIPDAPGLGVAVNEEVVERFAI